MITEKDLVISIPELNLNKLKKYNDEEYSKIRYDLEIILKGQKINQKDLQLRIIGLANQNNELLKSNKKLNDPLETVVRKLNELKKEREEKINRKEARANRKRLPKRDPVTLEIYQTLIHVTEAGTGRSSNYTAARLRVALCLRSN